MLCKGINIQFSVQYLLLGIFAHERVIATQLRLLYNTFAASNNKEDYYGRYLNIPVNRGSGVSQRGIYSCPLGLSRSPVTGEQKVADWLARTVMTRMGWFTPPFDTANDVRNRLEPYYDILDFHVEGAMLYFRAKKR